MRSSMKKKNNRAQAISEYLALWVAIAAVISLIVIIPGSGGHGGEGSTFLQPISDRLRSYVSNVQKEIFYEHWRTKYWPNPHREGQYYQQEDY